MNLTADVAANWSKIMAKRFLHKYISDEIESVHLFLPIKKWNEPDTSWVYKKLWSEEPDLQVLVPISDFKTLTFKNIQFDIKSKTIETEHGIPEPIDGSETNSSLIDLVLVPLLAFDENGYRVGYGKGFYDRFFAQCGPDTLKIGYSFFEPIPKISDLGVHDIPLDACITPEQIYEF